MGTTDSAIDLKGIIPATVLPMTQDAQIDEPELRRYIRWIADTGIRAVAVNVDTGEGPHLWHEERLRVLRIYREELAGRGIPIVAGLGASFTAQAVKYAREYREAGAECLLVFPITAYLGKPLSSEVPYRYHKAIAEESGLPLILFTLQPALGGTDFARRDVAAPDRDPPGGRDQGGPLRRQAVSRDRQRRAGSLAADHRPDGQRQLHLGVLPAGSRGGAARRLRRHDAHPRRSSTRRRCAATGRWCARRGTASRGSWTPSSPPPVRDYRARCKEVLVMQGILKHAHMRPPLMPVGADDRQRLKQALEEAGEL